MTSGSGGGVKAPITCPECHDWPLELEHRDHQHLSCPNCRHFFCVVCVGCVARTVAEYARIRRAATMN